MVAGQEKDSYPILGYQKIKSNCRCQHSVFLKFKICVPYYIQPIEIILIKGTLGPGVALDGCHLMTTL